MRSDNLAEDIRSWKMKKIGIIFGGKSTEHEVSQMSAASVLRAIDKKKFTPVTIGITKTGEWKLFEGDYDKIENGEWEKEAKPFRPSDLKNVCEFAFPVLHGLNGEDGTIQGLFEMLDIPYAGCGVAGSASTMDKGIARDIFRCAGLPMCKHVAFISADFNDDPDGIMNRIERELGYPCFVKPSNMGSSVGISKAHDRAELKKGLEEAIRIDRRIVVEEAVDAREVEIAVIGNDYPETAAIGEILPSDEFYTYHSKYFDNGETKLVIPADITDEQRAEIQRIAKIAYKACDCSGLSRVDFFIDRKTGKVLLNEINTIPGFTAFSMFSLLWAEAGVPYPELIERIVNYGYERYNAKAERFANWF